MQDPFRYVNSNQIPAAFSGMFQTGEGFANAMKTLVPSPGPQGVENLSATEEDFIASMPTRTPRKVKRHRQFLTPI